MFLYVVVFSAATLLFGTGEQAIHHLFSRNTHLELNYGPLFAVLVYYFIMACWASGTSISSGLVVPMLYANLLHLHVYGTIFVYIYIICTLYDELP